MTITSAHLDELERRAKAGRNLGGSDVTLHLVAVYRAALAFVQSDDEDRVAEFDALLSALRGEP